MPLPTEKTKRIFNFYGEKILLWGAPKKGKTTLVSELGDKIVFIATESGQSKVEAYVVPVKTWEEFEATIKEVKADPRFEMSCIDTIDALWQLYLTYFLKKHKVEHEGEIAYKGHDMIKRGFISVFYELQAVGKGFIFLAHDRVAEDDSGVKGPRRCQPNLPYDKQHIMRDTIEGMCDFIWYLTDGASIGADGKAAMGRVIRTAASNEYVAGSRFPIIDPIPLVDGDPKASAKKIYNAYQHAAASATKKNEGGK